jgi:DNA-binding response OmpR family regulator
MPPDELARDLEVLVVDDEPGIRELLVGYFRARAFRVASARDGTAAITTLQRSGGRFRLVVTDLNLPGADGFAVLQAARQANTSCFVVIITGYASLDSAIRAVRVGAYDYLTKPFSLGQLDMILSRIREVHLGNGQRTAGRTEAGHSGSDSSRPSGRPSAPLSTVTVGTRPPVAVEVERVIDGEVVVADLPVLVGAGAASSSIERRLDRLEAAFGRVEALLRARG